MNEEEINNKSLTNEILTLKQNGNLIPISTSNSLNIQFENKENNLNEEEKLEKEFYGTPISNLSFELFRNFGDIMKNSLVNLKRDLFPILRKSFSEEESNNIIDNFTENFSKNIFDIYLDKGELKMKEFLKFHDIEKKYEDYIINKKTIPMEKIIEKEKQEIDKFFNKEKNEYYDLMKEDIKLRVEIKVQELISAFRNNLFSKNSNENIDNQIKKINENIKSKPNLEIMNNNLNFIDQQLDKLNKIINNF
jgi:hypothetical protein